MENGSIRIMDMVIRYKRDGEGNEEMKGMKK